MKKSVKRRRLKKTIRRTIGALFMISAIIIAAIPFPEARADEGEVLNPYNYNVITTTDSISDDNLDKINRVEYADSNAKAYTIRRMRDENQGDYWKLEWQFQFAKLEGIDHAITKYNNNYLADLVEISSRVRKNYFIVTQDDVNRFYTTDSFSMTDPITESELTKRGGNDDYIYPIDDESIRNRDRWFFERYCSDIYTKYSSDLDNYNQSVEIHEKWLLEGGIPGDPNEPVVLAPPTQLIMKPSEELSPTDKLKFFCDVMIEGDGKFILEEVSDARESDIESDIDSLPTVYIPKGPEKPVGVADYKIDTNGFLTGEEYSITGVAQNAFKDTQNVENLILSEAISYIGDSAFENSFVSNVVLKAVKNIGNATFKDCEHLNTIVLPEKIVNLIGTEAFYNTGITNFSIPSSVSKIGAGAFANCTNLKTICFDGEKTNKIEIGKYAFFNCTNLDSVDFGNAEISKIDEGAFAVDGNLSGNMTEFTFPSTTGSIDETGDLGDFILAGRANLNHIIMPANFGRSKKAVIKPNVFWGCINLECLEFPDDGNGSCGYVEYPEDNMLFATIVNPDFHVKGPKFNRVSETAGPRKATWKTYFLNNKDNHVPYVYVEGGKEQYEVSDGEYILTIKDGELLHCDLVNSSSTEKFDLVIPGKVGNTIVKKINKICFNDVLNKIKTLEVKDSEIEELDIKAFYGAESLEKVILGDSVKVIGEETFSNCPNLTEVTIGKGISSIGESAFEGCDHLVNIVFMSPKEVPSDALPTVNIGEDAFKTGSPKLTIEGEIGSEYGPFAWAMDPKRYVNELTGLRVCYKTPSPSSLTVILDNQNNLPTLVDYPNYKDLDSDLIDRFERMRNHEENVPITTEEIEQAMATIEINVPEGVKSIDSKGFITNDSKKNVEGGRPNVINSTTYGLPNRTEYSTDGLFLENEHIEKVTLNSVEYLPDSCFKNCKNLKTLLLGSKMEDVGQLPIENCTSLISIACGNDKYVANNGILYENLVKDGSEKAIVECFASRGRPSNEEKKFPGYPSISVTTDEDLKSVVEIKDEAFRNCDHIITVDFRDANKFSKIPISCFEDCDELKDVILPENVNEIGTRAFANTKAGPKVVVRGKEVSLGESAFAGVAAKSRLASYKNSAVLKAAIEQGVNGEELDNLYTIDFYSEDGLIYLGSDFVEEGKTAEAPDDDKIPGKEGYRFIGWNKSLRNITKDDFVLAVYEEITPGGVQPGTTPGGVQPGTTPGGVQPETKTGTTPGATNKVSPTPKVSPTTEAKKYQLTVIYGSGSGQYASGTTVIINAIEPPAGKVFDRWVVTGSGLTIASATSMATTVKTSNSDATVTATYKNTGSVSGNSSRSSNKSGGAIETRSTGDNKTRVDITKDGISNTDKAYASVKGSSDNFIVKISESADAANQVATALSNQYSDMTPIKYFAMDISLYDATGTNKIENVDGLSINITMPIPDALVQYAGNNKIGAVVNGSLEVLNCKFITIDGIPCVSFTATHFSPYTVFVDTANLTEGTLDATPKTGDGIHPKWFVVMAFVCISLILLLKKDRVKIRVA